jgi:hypothetical protein
MKFPQASQGRCEPEDTMLPFPFARRREPRSRLKHHLEVDPLQAPQLRVFLAPGHQKSTIKMRTKRFSRGKRKSGIQATQEQILEFFGLSRSGMHGNPCQ